nr:MAG TPA: hypothetical protein [Caudoviricetes sp.]
MMISLFFNIFFCPKMLILFLNLFFPFFLDALTHYKIK